MTERKECTIYLVASAEGYEVSTELESAHELYGDNVTSYGARRVFKLNIVVPVDEIVVEGNAVLPEIATEKGGNFDIEVKPTE
jgi:hypothetical protein